MPTYHVPLNDAYHLDETYTVATGCCVTSPLVAGIAALLLSINPNLSPNEISFILRASTEPIDSPYYLGTGCVNAYNALVYNNKPERPDGPHRGNISEEHTFSSSIAYVKNESLYYLWDFGDGTQNEWIGPINSNEICENTHKFKDEGEYSIKVKVKDNHGGESEWSDPLTVTMPKIRIQVK
jgi:subtilisin family serine protease